MYLHALSHLKMPVHNSDIPYSKKLSREKTLANLVNHHNSPSFFANIPDEARGHQIGFVNVLHVKQGTKILHEMKH